MKKQILIFSVLISALAFMSACVDTVNGRKTAGVPFLKDSVEGKYERPLDQVFGAAKEVIKFNGTISHEGIDHTATNTVKSVEGKVNQRTVWIRVEEMSPKI